MLRKVVFVVMLICCFMTVYAQDGNAVISKNEHSSDQSEQTVLFLDDPFRIQGLRWTYNNKPVMNFYSFEMSKVFSEYDDSYKHYLSSNWKNTTGWICIGLSIVGLVVMVVSIPDAIETGDMGLFFGSAGASLVFSLTSMPFSLSSSVSLNRAIETYNNNARNKARQQR